MQRHRQPLHHLKPTEITKTATTCNQYFKNNVIFTFLTDGIMQVATDAKNQCLLLSEINVQQIPVPLLEL